MSVLMTFRVRGNAQQLEARAAANPDAMRSLADRAKEHGLIAHRFFGSEDGWIMALDEWEDAAGFQKFFDSARAEIEPMMADVGVTDEPEVTFWRKLDSRDEVGWES